MRSVYAIEYFLFFVVNLWGQIVDQTLILNCCPVYHFYVRLVPASLLTSRIPFHFRGNPQRIDAATANRRVTFTYEQVSPFLYIYFDARGAPVR